MIQSIAVALIKYCRTWCKMNDYYICDIEGCGEQIRNGRFCHYHSSITDRPCAWYYHNDLGTAAVEWCGKKNKRFIEVSCKGCEDHIKPENGIEIIEKLTGLNGGGK